jgi:hypothetical protein
MLDLVTANRFDRRMGSGKTKPMLLACTALDGNGVEVITKVSAGCERGVGGLIAEAITAMLAADLDLPVPEPFLVRLDQKFIDTWPDAEVRGLAKKSAAVGFGSKKLPNGFVTWPMDKAVPPHLRATAAEILAFDILTLNDDRRPSNPNCLCDGNEFAIFDHELNFLIDGVIGRKPPWEPGSLEYFCRPRAHLFSDSLRGREFSLDRIAGAWEGTTDARLTEFQGALPTEWSADNATAEKILGYIKKVRDNVQPALAEISRVLA